MRSATSLHFAIRHIFLRDSNRKSRVKFRDPPHFPPSLIKLVRPISHQIKPFAFRHIFAVFLERVEKLVGKEGFEPPTKCV